MITMALVGLLIFYYRTERLLDNVFAVITGIAAVGIGVFSMRPDWDARPMPGEAASLLKWCDASLNCSPTFIARSYDLLNIPGYGPIGLHGLCLTLFVLGGLYLVFFSFPYTAATKTKGVNEGTQKPESSIDGTAQKKLRNSIIVRCGIVMLVAIILFAVSPLFGPEGKFKGWMSAELYSWYRFLTESTFVSAFAFSWLIKGQFVPFMKGLNSHIQDPPAYKSQSVRQAKKVRKVGKVKSVKKGVG